MKDEKVVPERYKKILNEARKIQDTNKPFNTYTRHQTWNGQECIFCRSKEGIKEVNGRFVVGYSETGDLMLVCGICLERILEKDWILDYE